MRFKKITVAVLLIFIVTLPVFSLTFNDIKRDYWAHDNIEELSELGVINGYQDGSFRPNNKISRAEFAKLLATVYISEQDVDFDDGRTFIRKTFGSDFNNWSKKYLFVLSLYDILLSDDTKLDIKSYNGQISRGEMAVMVARAINMGDPRPSDLKDRAYFGDKVKEIDAVYQSGIIRGYPDGTYKMSLSATRAEASKIIANFIAYKKLTYEDVLYNTEMLKRLSLD